MYVSCVFFLAFLAESRFGFITYIFYINKYYLYLSVKEKIHSEPNLLKKFSFTILIFQMCRTIKRVYFSVSLFLCILCGCKVFVKWWCLYHTPYLCVYVRGCLGTGWRGRVRYCDTARDRGLQPATVVCVPFDRAREIVVTVYPTARKLPGK